MYGRLTAELIERAGQTIISGTSLTYADLRRYRDPRQRRPAPESFPGGIAATDDGIFIPYDAQLHPASGYIVPPYLWAYMTRADLFPAGWLHDIGLPLTEAFKARTYKNGKLREITMQAFERAVLTYDPLNPVAGARHPELSLLDCLAACGPSRIGPGQSIRAGFLQAADRWPSAARH